MSEPMSTRTLAPIPTIRASLTLLFSFLGPKLLAAQLVIAIGLRIALGDWQPLDGIMVGAIAIWWPFQEWLFHRYLLHSKPFSVLGRRLSLPGAKEHRAHHREPWRLDYVLLPPHALLPLIPLNLLFWWAITPDIARMLTGVAAFTAVTLWYEWVHYIVHVPYRPRTAWLKRVSRNHRLHHFKNEHYWFAFSLPIIDQALRTAPDPKSVPKSPTVRTLGVDEEDGVHSP